MIVYELQVLYNVEGNIAWESDNLFDTREDAEHAGLILKKFYNAGQKGIVMLDWKVKQRQVYRREFDEFPMTMGKSNI